MVAVTIIVACSSYLLNKNVPFSGDEFYTLDIQNVHKPIPYYYLVSNLIDGLGQIKPQHIFYLRLTSIVFTSLAIVLLFLFIPKTQYELIVLAALIITNPFILSVSIFFRYYSYYLLSSVISFVILILEFERFDLKTKTLIGFLGSILSIPFLFVFNTLQFGIAFMETIVSEIIRNKKLKYIICGFSLLILTIFIFNPILIWKLLYAFEISGHAAVDLNSSQIMGISKSTFIKPFFAIFQMVFGPNISPTYSIYIIGLFFFLGVVFIIIFYRIFRNKKHLFLRLLLCVIIPFFLIYYFFQTLSLPGATQLEPKHGILLFPLILYLTVKSHKYLSLKMHALFLFGILCAQLAGMVKSIDKKYTNWNKIASQSHSVLSQNDDAVILMDGRSREIWNFYSQEIQKDHPVYYTWQNIDSLKSYIIGKSKLLLLLNDYKSYTNLSMRQNWNAGASSELRFNHLHELINHLNEFYEVKESYVVYPTFLYALEKKKIPNDSKSFSVWEHHLKDIQLPINNESTIQVFSSVLIRPQKSLHVDLSNEVIINLENYTDTLNEGDTIGFIRKSKYDYPLIFGDNIWSIFSDYHDKAVKDSNVFYKWMHTPLVSGSIQYPGSFMRHEAVIFKIDDHGFNGRSEIVNMTDSNSIRIWTN